MALSSTPSQAERHLLRLALFASTGPALLVDEHLRLIFSTPNVETLLHHELPWGRSVIPLLCGTKEHRPIFEALAEGRSASTEIVLPHAAEGSQILKVRSFPLREGGTIQGHILYLTQLGKVQGGVSVIHGVLTASDSMRELLNMVDRVAPSDASILVRGETGSGKELIARAIHEASPRRNKPFSAINCASLPEQLLESELFGHEKGSFTGAVRDTEGTFRHTEGGTLFLDEVAEMPLSVQAKLLRVLQEKTVLPVGGHRAIPVDVRIVSATHRSLRQEVLAGRFREDLMYRLRVIPLFLPPLRDRRADIEPLTQLFISQKNEKTLRRRIEHIQPAALDTLLRYDFPGNVRQLQNIVEYAFYMGDGPLLTEADLPLEVRNAQDDAALPQQAGASRATLSGEAARIHSALEQAAGTREVAARLLGISRSTLWRRMKEYGLL